MNLHFRLILFLFPPAQTDADVRVIVGKCGASETERTLQKCPLKTLFPLSILEKKVPI